MSLVKDWLRRSRDDLTSQALRCRRILNEYLDNFQAIMGNGLQVVHPEPVKRERRRAMLPHQPDSLDRDRDLIQDDNSSTSGFDQPSILDGKLLLLHLSLEKWPSS